MTNKAVCVRLSPDSHKVLRKMAFEQGVPMGHLVEQALPFITSGDKDLLELIFRALAKHVRPDGVLEVPVDKLPVVVAGNVLKRIDSQSSK